MKALALTALVALTSAQAMALNCGDYQFTLGETPTCFNSSFGFEGDICEKAQGAESDLATAFTEEQRAKLEVVGYWIFSNGGDGPVVGLSKADNGSYSLILTDYYDEAFTGKYKTIDCQ
jgi:hypothetical protein